LGIWKLDQYSEIKEPVLAWNCSSKKLQRTSSRSYHETTGSLKIFKNLEPAVTLKFLKKTWNWGSVFSKFQEPRTGSYIKEKINQRTAQQWQILGV
jgi:hypothetical protein